MALPKKRKLYFESKDGKVRNQFRAIIAENTNTVEYAGNADTTIEQMVSLWNERYGDKAEKCLYSCIGGDVVLYQGNKYRVTDEISFGGADGIKMEQRYIYPYLPYSQEGISNNGFSIPSNTLIELIKV